MSEMALKRRQLNRRRLRLSFFGAIWPLLCLAISTLSSPEWQDDRLATYAWLFLSKDVSPSFAAFIIFAFGGLLVAVWLPRTRGNIFVRLAIFSGLLLSLQYAAVATLALGLVESGTSAGKIALFLAVVATANPVFWRHLFSLLGRLGWPMWVLAAAALYGLALTFFLGEGGSPPQVLLLPAVVCLAGTVYYFVVTAPFWSLWVYAGWTKRFPLWFASSRRPLALGLGVGWLAGWIAAWRVGLQRLLLAYAELPTEPPGNCFIASTAAQGHAGFVGATAARATDGRLFPATLQLRRLKVAEWLIRELAPPVHRGLRLIYDAVGPHLARRLRHPWLADIAWLALKPFELLAWIVLRVFVAEGEQVASRLWPAEEPRLSANHHPGRPATRCEDIRR